MEVQSHLSFTTPAHMWKRKRVVSIAAGYHILFLYNHAGAEHSEQNQGLLSLWSPRWPKWVDLVCMLLRLRIGVDAGGIEVAVC
eukprot:1161263-Pelagomonas_calceolata.AAC.26